MENVSISLARIAVFLEIQALDPKGSQTTPEAAQTLLQRYNFAQTPKTAEEMDYTKGVTFKAGRFQDVAIDQFQVFHNGIIIDTRSSTDDSMRVLNDVLSLAKERNQANIKVNRMHFISQLIFTSKLKLALLNPILQPIADRLSMRSSQDLDHPIQFEPTAILLGAQTWQLKVSPNQFSIERRADIPFRENTYFSAAPLPTSEHIALVEEIEAALTPTTKPN